MVLEPARLAIDFDQGILNAKNVIYFYPDGSAAGRGSKREQWGGVHSPPRIHRQFTRHHAVGRHRPATGVASLQERGEVLLEATVKAQESERFPDTHQTDPEGFHPDRGHDFDGAPGGWSDSACWACSAMAMATTQTSQQNGIAKQLANETIESILTARETANVTWSRFRTRARAESFWPGFNRSIAPESTESSAPPTTRHAALKSWSNRDPTECTWATVLPTCVRP